jgi:hypothetical protein
MANTSAHDVKNQAQATGAKAAEQVRDVAGQAADKARDVASSAAQTARGAASYVGQQAEDLTGRLGSGVSSMADTLRSAAPHEGYLGQAAGTVADTLDSTGRYIQREGLGGMAGDLTTMIKNNPIPAMLLGVGLGFLLARLTTRS